MEGEGKFRITLLDDGNALGERKPAGNLCATHSSNAASSRTPSSTAPAFDVEETIPIGERVRRLD
jgi:hypothetical protein